MFKTRNYAGARVFVTGDTGFSGVWLSTLLSEMQAEVLGYSRDDTNFSTLFPPGEGGKIWQTFIGDVNDSHHLKAQMLAFKPDLVFHLAAQSLVSEGYKNPLETFKSNSLGTASVLDACLSQKNLKGVIIITTDKVYKEGPGLNAEDAPLEGKDPYSSSKVCAEHVVLGYRQIFQSAGIFLTVVRGGNIIGGGDWAKTRIVPDLMRAFLSAQPLQLRYPGASRPWQHVLELVGAYAFFGDFILGNRGALVNSEYNIGPRVEREYSVMDVVKEFDSNGLSVKTEIVPAVSYESNRLRISSLKAQSVLAWSPKLDFSKSVQLTADWYKSVCLEGRNSFAVSKEQVSQFISDRSPL